MSRFLPPAATRDHQGSPPASKTPSPSPSTSEPEPANSGNSPLPAIGADFPSWLEPPPKTAGIPPIEPASPSGGLIEFAVPTRDPRGGIRWVKR